MHVSQAAVGQQMKRLEILVGAAIFERTGKAPKLNNLAHSIIPRAREVVREYDSLLSEMGGTVSLEGEISLGAVPSTLRGLIPLSIKALVRNYPNLHIRVVAGTSADLQELVERGALDAALVSKLGTLGSNLHWQTIVEEELVLLCSPGVLLNEPETLLRELPYVRLAGRNSVRQLADDWLADQNIAVRATMEMESLETLSSMVAHNLGVSIVPNFCVKDPIFESLKKVPLKTNPRVRTLGMLTRTDCLKLNIVNALIPELKAIVAEHAESAL